MWNPFKINNKNNFNEQIIKKNIYNKNNLKNEIKIRNEIIISLHLNLKKKINLNKFKLSPNSISIINEEKKKVFSKEKIKKKIEIINYYLNDFLLNIRNIIKLINEKEFQINDYLIYKKELNDVYIEIYNHFDKFKKNPKYYLNLLNHFKAYNFDINKNYDFYELIDELEKHKKEIKMLDNDLDILSIKLSDLNKIKIKYKKMFKDFKIKNYFVSNGNFNNNLDFEIVDSRNCLNVYNLLVQTDNPKFKDKKNELDYYKEYSNIIIDLNNFYKSLKIENFTQSLIKLDEIIEDIISGSIDNHLKVYNENKIKGDLRVVKYYNDELENRLEKFLKILKNNNEINTNLKKEHKLPFIN